MSRARTLPGIDPGERRRRMQSWRRQSKKPPGIDPRQLELFRDPEPPTKSPAQTGPKDNRND